MGPSRMRWFKVTEWCAAGLGFLALSFVFCYPVGLADALSTGYGDVAQAYFPYLLRSFRPVSPSVAGPWDPTQFTGLPESHTPAGRYYPPTVFFGTLFPPALALSLILVWHHGWAGFGAYLLARDGGRSRPAAWLAGIVFGFGGFLVFHRGHPPLQQTAAWLPWVLWGFERFRRTGSAVWVAVTGTLLSLHALAGNQQMVVMGAIVWLTYLTYFGWSGTGDRRARVRFVLGGLAACLLGAVGSLPQVLPALEVARWSGYGKVNADFCAEGYLKVRFLIGLVGPWVLGGAWGVPRPGGYDGVTDQGLYYGLLPLAAAAAAVSWFLLRPRQPAEGSPDHRAAHEAGFWLVLLGESLVLMLGKGIGVHHVLVHVPVYNFFHLPCRHVWAFGMALAWLAALGLDRLSARGHCLGARMAAWTARTFLLLAVITAVVVGTMPYWPARPGVGYPGFWVPVVTGLLAVGVVAVLARHQRPARLAPLIPILAFLELWLNIGRYELWPERADGLVDASRFPDAVRRLGRQVPTGPPPRCLIGPGSVEAGGTTWDLPSGYGAAWGLASLSTYSQSMPRGLTRLLHLNPYGIADVAAVVAERRGLSAVAGQYFLARDRLPPIAPGFGYRLAARDDLVWKTDDHSSGHPSPLKDRGPEPSSSLVAQLPGTPGPVYFLEGRLRSRLARPGAVRVVGTTHAAANVVCGTTCDLEQGQGDSSPDGEGWFGITFDRGLTGAVYWLTIDFPGAPVVELADCELWQLTTEFAANADRLSPGAVSRRLHAGIREPLPLLARYPSGLRVYQNPEARPLAILVGEVRPAVDDLAAVNGILSGGGDVREVCYIVAPRCRSGDLAISAPLRFAPGTVELCSYRPDDLAVHTTAVGDAFLVLAVTRCTGWSATVDGQAVSIYPVDGALMGIRVPPGEHVVRFRFRPVLVWAGETLAFLALGGAWLWVFISLTARRLKPPSQGIGVSSEGERQPWEPGRQSRPVPAVETVEILPRRAG